MTPAQAFALRLATWKAAADKLIAEEAEAAKAPSLPKPETKDRA